MTTGTTASGSENWETYSDASELEPERDVRDAHHPYSHGQISHVSANPLALGQSINGQKRPMANVAGAMAPPPAKHHNHAQPNGFSRSQYGRGPDPQQDRYREMSDENAHSAGVRIEGSDAAWSTELEESY
jgi:hypothetical protein